MVNTVTMVVEWDVSEGANDITIKDSSDVSDYIESCVQSNANFDHVGITVLSTKIS